MVALVVASVLAVWTRDVVRALPSAPAAVRFPAEGSVLVVLVAVGFVLVWNKSFAPLESVGLLPAAGWAVLAVGLAAAAAQRRWEVGAALLGLAGAALLTLYFAYHRDGGWPGVAGWEYNGMQSPVVLSVAAAALLLTAAPAGAALGALRSRTATQPAQQAPQATEAAVS